MKKSCDSLQFCSGNHAIKSWLVWYCLHDYSKWHHRACFDFFFCITFFFKKPTTIEETHTQRQSDVGYMCVRDTYWYVFLILISRHTQWDCSLLGFCFPQKETSTRYLCANRSLPTLNQSVNHRSCLWQRGSREVSAGGGQQSQIKTIHWHSASAFSRSVLTTDIMSALL